MQKSNLSFPKFNVLLVALLLLANIGVWLAQIFQGVAWLEPKPEELIAWGGNLAVYSLTTESWRLLSNIFVHSGLLHLVLNMYMLLSVGLLAGRRFGAAGLAVVYLLGGVLASIASAWWQMHTMFPAPSALGISIFGHTAPSIRLIVSVGASGAIMTVCGALLAAMLRDFNAAVAVSEEDQGIGKSLLQVVGINLAIGFVVQGIDQSAHIGGLVTGFALGMVLPMTAPAAKLLHRILRTLVPAMLVGMLAWWLVHTLPTQELRDVLAQLTQEKTEAQDEAGKATKLKKADLQAAEEKRNLPVAVFERELAMGQVIQVGKNATDMAISADEKFAYVVDTIANQLNVVDLQSGQVIRSVSAKKIPLKKEGYCDVNMAAGQCDWQGAGSVAVVKDQTMAVVPSMVKDGVALVDIASGKIVKTLATGKLPGSVILSPDDSRAYVVNAGDGTLSAIDLKALQLIKTVKVSQVNPKASLPFRTALWLSADAKAVFVSNTPESQVEIFDATTLVHTKYEIPSIQISKLVKTSPQANHVFNLIPGRGVAQMDIDTLKSQNIWELCPGGLDDMNLAVELNDKDQHLLALSKFTDPDNGRFSSVPMWTGRSDMPGVKIFKTMVQVVKLETGVTMGSYPVDGRTVKLQFSKDTKSLFALSDLGTLSRFDLSKRLDLDQDVICK